MLAESATLANAAPKILQTICESLSWDMGLLWGVDEPGQLLRCLHVWHPAEVTQAPFEVFSQQHAFRRGIGLSGCVWASGQPLWVTDVQHDDNFPRAPFAVELGLHGALAFPLKLHGHVVGVLECFSHHIRQPDADLLQMLGRGWESDWSVHGTHASPGCLGYSLCEDGSNPCFYAVCPAYRQE